MDLNHQPIIPLHISTFTLPQGPPFSTSIPALRNWSAAIPLLAPDRQQVTIGLFLRFSSFTLFGILFSGIFTDSLMCPARYSSGVRTSTINAPFAKSSVTFSLVFPPPNNVENIPMISVSCSCKQRSCEANHSTVTRVTQGSGRMRIGD